MQPSEVYVLKSELALRRHAVLLPAEVPTTKRQRTSGSVQSTACARAHAFTPDSPLSPSRVSRSVSATKLTQNRGITEDPAGSPAESSGDEALFAVRTNSELEAACSDVPQAAIHQPASDAAKLPAEEAAADGLQASSEQQLKSDITHALHPLDEHAASRQQSTAGPGVSAPSNTSHETNVGTAVSKGGTDSPSSPQLLSRRITAPANEAPPMLPTTQCSNLQHPTANSGLITINQLLSAGPYQVNVDQQQVVARNLKMYKAKVDSVHALGRVSPSHNKFAILSASQYTQDNRLSSIVTEVLCPCSESQT